MVYLKLTNSTINSGTAVTLLGGELSYQWKNLTSANPGNSFFASTESQFSGWENPIMSLSFHINVNSIPTGTMTWDLWNQFVKAQYLGTSSTQTFLSCQVGTSTLFTDYSASSSSTGVTSIPIQINSSTLSFSPGDSDNAHFWTINCQLQVTK